jgi:hypothetical protein
MRRYLTTMQVNPDNSPKSEYLPDQIHSDQVPTWPIVQNLYEYLMPNPDLKLPIPTQTLNKERDKTNLTYKQ